MTTPDPAPPPEELGISLVCDDLPFRLQRRLGLVPRKGGGVVRRAVFWSLVAWLPIAGWAWYRHRLLPPTDVEPLLAHYGIPVRFLVAAPLFILAEGIAHVSTTKLIPHFVTSGVVPPAEVPRFRAVLERAVKLRNSTLPWIAILALIIAISTASELFGEEHAMQWAVERGGYGFGGWWLLWVARPIYLTLALSWLWRVVLLFLIFRRIAGLELSIVPTHPDKAGGLGFVARIPALFAPVAFAFSAIVASRWAHEVVYHGASVLSFKLQMAAFVILALCLFVSPLLPFMPRLARAKNNALLDYGTLVGRQGRLVRRRWVEGKEIEADGVLDAPELGPVADLNTAYDAVNAMRPLPIGALPVVPLLVALALPMVVVVALQVPVKDIVAGLLNALM